MEKIKYFQWAGAGKTFSLFLFGYTCQQNVLDAYSELNTSNIRRMKKVVMRQFLIVTGIYILIGLFGYFNYPDYDPEDRNILQFYDPTKQYPALVAIVLLTLAIIVPLPLIFKPCKDCLALLIYPEDPDHPCIHYPLSIGLAMGNMMLCSYAVVSKISMSSM